jgi:hypothetical protein
MLTYDSPPDVEGQQLMVRGTSPSGSLVCKQKTTASDLITKYCFDVEWVTGKRGDGQELYG